jgi:hypothetical protein
MAHDIALTGVNPSVVEAFPVRLFTGKSNLSKASFLHSRFQVIHVSEADFVILPCMREDRVSGKSVIAELLKPKRLHVDQPHGARGSGLHGASRPHVQEVC